MSIVWQRSHLQNLPTIRLAAIQLEDFKSVKNGEIVFNCGKKHIPYGTQADILGLYGQNGSGKTSLVEALAILKNLLSGDSVPDEYADCVDVSSDYATLTFTFDVQYPRGTDCITNGDVRKIVYSVKLSTIDKDEVERPDVFSTEVKEVFDEFLPVSKRRVRVFDEVLKVGGTIHGEKVPLKPFVDTSKAKSYIEPLTKAKLLVGALDEDKRIQLGINKRLAAEKSQSYVFMQEMMALFSDNSEYSVYYQMLLELRKWGREYLYVVDSKSTGMVRMNFMLPFFDGANILPVPTNDRFTVSNEEFDKLQRDIASLDMVISQIVPGMNVVLKDYGKTLTKFGEEGHIAELISKRGDKEIPLRCESDGVQKLLVTLNYLIAVYNKQSVTVAYDEFDAGVFEYLLGEILQVLQDYGVGQFIFTSHNMRPLEILKKEFVWFTTTDPEERYIKLTGLGETNNLRKVYYREIALNEHYDNLYSETKRNKIISAMRKAGGR